VNLAFAKADGGVERGEAAETDRDGEHGRPGTQSPVFLLKDWDEFGGRHRLQITGFQMTDYSGLRKAE
jgi:hypothetical protein